MPFSIKVSNLENHSTWEKNLTAAESQNVRSYVDSSREASFLPFYGMIKPIRTNNLKNLAKDLFCPTLFTYALKVENEVGKIFAILAALILDTMTFPIRLLTCIPRIKSNARQEENPLKKYLINENVDLALIESDHVHVNLVWEQEGIRHWNYQHVNFIELPYYKGCDERTYGSS